MHSRSITSTIVLIATCFAATETTAQLDEYSSAVRPDPEGTPTPVSLRVVVSDVSLISDIDQMFDADLFFVLGWKDQRLAGSMPRVLPMADVWHPRFIILNLRTSNLRLPEEVHVAPDGTVEYVQRVIGTFSSPLDLREFPTDEQVLTVEGASYWYGSDEIELAVREELVTIGDFTAAGWRLAARSLEAGTLRVEATGREFVRARVLIDAERVSEYYVYTLLVPLVLIVAMAWTVFWIDPGLLPSQIAVSTASVFTLIAFRFSLRLVLPPTTYMTLADRFVLGCTVLVFFALGQAVTTGRLAKMGRENLAQNMDVWGRWIYIAGFVLVWFVA